MDNREEVWVVVKTVNGNVQPACVVRGDRSDAEAAAAQMPAWYVLDSASLNDWR